MTTIYTEKERIVVHNEIVSRTCDWCNDAMPVSLDPGLAREFVFTSGYCYPGNWGGSGWCIADLCDSCVKKLENLLVSSGINITDIDY